MLFHRTQRKALGHAASLLAALVLALPNVVLADCVCEGCSCCQEAQDSAAQAGCCSKAQPIKSCCSEQASCCTKTASCEGDQSLRPCLVGTGCGSECCGNQGRPESTEPVPAELKRLPQLAATVPASETSNAFKPADFRSPPGERLAVSQSPLRLHAQLGVWLN